MKHTKIKRKKYRQYCIDGSEKLVFNLNLIKEKTSCGYSNKQIIEQFVNPVAEMLVNLREPCGYIIIPQGNEITIQFYSRGNIVQSGMNQPLSSVIGCDQND